MRFVRVLGLLVVVLVLLSACTAKQTVSSSFFSQIRHVYSLPDGSKLTVCGVIAKSDQWNEDIKPSYANFDIHDGKYRTHVYWKFPSTGKPTWFQPGTNVSVSGTYWISNPKHPEEPEIVADSVQPLGKCASCTTQSTSASSEPPFALRVWGAAGEVAGSCYQITVGSKNILIDCGSFMNGDDAQLSTPSNVHRDTDPFPFDPVSIDAVLLTHAHDDHMGRIQYLYADGFNGKLWMTKATKAIFVAKLDELIRYSRLSASAQVGLKERIERSIKTVDYGRTVHVTKGIDATFVDAGHIPGSASIVLNLQDGKENHTITFSGDIGSGHHPFLNTPDLASLSHTDTETLVIESTYGGETRDYPEDKDLYREFLRQLKQALDKRHLVVISTFALDRTQRVLSAIEEGMRNDELPRSLNVAVGGKSSCYLTNIYVEFQNNQKKYRDYFSDRFWSEKPLANPFWHYLRGDNCENTAEEEKRTDFKQFDIIVTPSGTGGSSLAKYLIQKYASDPQVTFIKVGWAPSYSPMGQLAHTEPGGTIEIDGQKYPVRAEVIARDDISGVFSGHADQNMLLKYISSFPKLSTVIITHGEDDARNALETAVKEQNPQLETIKPVYGEAIDLQCLSTTH